MFSGSLVALITPMKKNGEIDWFSYEELIQWHLEQGSDGLVVLGTTAESPTITSQERVQIIKRAVRCVNGRVPIIVGTGSNSTTKTIQYTHEAARLGVDAVLVVTPYYNKPPQSGLLAHFTAVAQSTHLPIVLYNVPSRTGCDLLPETAVKLSKISNIVAMKEATGDVSRVNAYKSLGADLTLLSGDDATCQEFIRKGGRGVISVAANIAPKQMRQLCEWAVSSPVEAEALQARLMPLFNALGVQSNPIPVKWAAAKMNLIPDGIRLPLLELESVYHGDLLRAMQQAGLTNEETK